MVEMDPNDRLPRPALGGVLYGAPVEDGPGPRDVVVTVHEAPCGLGEARTDLHSVEGGRGWARVGEGGRREGAGGGAGDGAG